ncbi:protein kinase [Candidatus Uabimicrobium sp. HlEnr_7]|uniref:serine/threonine-protein kinase n=1 Tax=Candidatus Uabimicrobium helgolandensis TaxID=3095367 RepID=UPI003556B5E0
MSTNQNRHKEKQKSQTVETLFTTSQNLVDSEENQELATQHTMIDNSQLHTPPAKTEHTIVENKTAQTQQTVLFNSQERIDCEERTRQTIVQKDSLQTKLPAVFAEKYEVLGILGSGAMGKVFKALDKTSNQQVAIKVIHKSQEDSQDIVKRFYRESKLLEKLNHPHIIKIYEQGEYEGQPYFVMDLVQGTTLTAVLKQKNYPLRRKLSLLIQVLEAVDCAHNEGVIHRDLKPDNIMVTPKAKALVMDFGIARDQDDQNATKLTKTGMLVGTPLYMSPEQINGEKVTDASDIYTLGVIMYEIITGKVPFCGNLSKIMWQVAHSDPTHPREVSNNIAKDLSKICLKAMAKEQEERYTTAKAMADDIRCYLKGQKISAKSSFGVKKWVSKNRNSLLLPCVVLIVGLIFLSQNKDKITGENNVVENDGQNLENSVTKRNDTVNDKHPKDKFGRPHDDGPHGQNKHPHNDRPHHDRPHDNGPHDKNKHPHDDRLHDQEPNDEDKHSEDGRLHKEPHHKNKRPGRSHDKELHDEDKQPRNNFGRHHGKNKRSENSRLHDRDKRRNKLDKPIDEEFFDEELEDNFGEDRPRRRRFEDIEERVDKRFERGNRNVDKRFENGEHPNRRNRLGSIDRKKISRSEMHKLNKHFRFCKECHHLLRKNRIKPSRPPRLAKLPKEIFLKIKAHAEKE